MGVAYDGPQAFSMFKSFSEKPDIILMDYKIPLLNGLETTKELIKIDPSLKVIGMSADFSIGNKFISNGAIDFIEKPFSVHDLSKKISKALRSLINE